MRLVSIPGASRRNVGAVVHDVLINPDKVVGIETVPPYTIITLESDIQFITYLSVAEVVQALES